MRTPLLLFHLLCICLLLCGSVYGQATLSGTVTDRKGDPLFGATVIVKESNRGANTGSEGKFRITELEAGPTVVRVSYFGYKPLVQEVELENGQTTEITFELEEDVANLDEVVVTGYGTQRKRDLIGTVEKIDNKELMDVVGGSFENVLQGKAPGIQITQTSGVAGSGSVIRIRGVASISAGGDPLIVVDGIPITQDPFLVGSNNGQNNNPLASINPNDIESVEVLKDASAAAIYGSRGANGVILITTKRGAIGKPQISFTSRIGFSTPTNRLELLNSEEWLQVRQEAWENDGNVGRAPLPRVLTENGYDYEDIEGIDTDWIDLVTHVGMKQEYSLSMRQGTQKLSTYAGITYSNAESYLVGNFYERAAGRVNVDYRPFKGFTASLSTSLTRGLNDRNRQAWAGGLGTAQTTALPIYPVYDEEGNFFNIYANPLAELEYYSNHVREWRSINSLQLTYRPSDRWNISISGNYDYMDLGEYELLDSVWTTAFNVGTSNVFNTHNYSTFGTVTYDILPEGGAHELRIMGGLEYQASRTDGVFEEHWDVGDHLYRNYEEGVDYALQNRSEFERDKWFFASVFGRLNYSFKNKMLVQLTYRRDGSSKFGANRRFGDFPSVGLGYILSEEPFLQNNPVLNFLKLKASWGITGNADIDWQSQFGIRSFLRPGEVNPGLSYNQAPLRFEVRPDNPNLQWEVVNNYDVGIEIGLFQDRITADFSYYYKRTTDALIFVSVQASSGLDALQYYQNIAELENQGFEFSITSRNIVGEFQWRTDFNIARNQNKVLDVGNAPPDALDGGFGDTRVVPGNPIGTNYLVDFSRVDPETGRPLYFDLEGNETFTYDVVNNRQAVDNIWPEYTGGITNTFSYKNFDLSVLFTFQLGGTIYDDAAKRQMGVVTDWNMRRDIFDRWRQPGDQTEFPQLTMSMLNWGGNANFWQNNHSLWLYDGTFGRLKNLMFGYNFRIEKENSLIRGGRIYFNGTNLLTFTNYPGWDPEISRDRNAPQERNVGGVGITYLTPPQEMTFNLGVNLEF